MSHKKAKGMSNLETMSKLKSPKWLPFLVVVAPMVMMLLWYIQRTFVDVVFLDGFINVPTIGRFLDGTLLPGDLFVRFGEHLILGYRVYALLNSRFLALDMRLDPIMFLIAFMVTAIIVYAEFSKIFNDVRLVLLGLLFLPLGLLSFSLVAPPLMNMSTQFAWGSTVALLTVWILQRDFDTSAVTHHRPVWPFILALILIPLYFLAFSGAYFPGLILGLGAMYAFRAFITRKWYEPRTMMIAAECAICALLYYYYMFALQSKAGSNASGGITHFFTDFPGTIMFYLAGIGGGLVDLHTLEATPRVFLLVGGIMAVIGAVALWLFVRTEMYRKTYLPVYCIFYTLGIITAVRLGRGLFGDWDWITNEWYAFHLRFFVIGVVWILLYTLVERVRRIRAGEARLVQWGSWPIVFSLMALVFVGAYQVNSNIHQWRRGPSVRGWLDVKRNALCFPDLFDQDQASDVLLWSAEDLAKDRAILERYDLSCFSPHGVADFVASSPDGILRGSDWYADDWIGRNGRAILVAQTDGQITFDGYTPEFIPYNHIEVRLNNELVYAGDLAGGSSFFFTGRLRKGINIITVTSEQAVSPASLGINPDMRPLAVRLSIRHP